MLICLDIKIPHLQIAHQGGNLEVGNIKIHLLRYTIDTFCKKLSWQRPTLPSAAGLETFYSRPYGVATANSDDRYRNPNNKDHRWVTN